MRRTAAQSLASFASRWRMRNGEESESCHVPTTGGGAGFRQPGFPLTGAHQSAESADCHQSVMGSRPLEAFGPKNRAWQRRVAAGNRLFRVWRLSRSSSWRIARVQRLRPSWTWQALVRAGCLQFEQDRECARSIEIGPTRWDVAEPGLDVPGAARKDVADQRKCREIDRALEDMVGSDRRRQPQD